MQAMLLIFAIIGQWDTSPQPATSGWDSSPQVAAVTRWDLSPRVPEPAANEPLVSAEAAPTPYSEVVRVLQLLPKPEVAFVDFGCGADARWCVAAAERWGCRAIGVEIDPARAAAAKEHVHSLGLCHLIEIIEGDATAVDVQADVGVAYLYPAVLTKLKPRIERLRAFASYMHQPPGVSWKNGDSWIAHRPSSQQFEEPQNVAFSRQAVWGGRTYQAPVCTKPNCAMCNAIRSQLAAWQAPQPQTSPTYRTQTGTNTGEIVTSSGGKETVTPPASRPQPNTGQCCCGGDTSKFCFCKDHGMKCACTPQTGSVWHLNGEWSADHKIAPAEPMWIPPKSQPASEPKPAPKPTWAPGTQFQWLTDGQYRDTPQPGLNYPSVGVFAQQQTVQSAPQQTQPATTGHWVKRCSNGQCRMEWVAG